MFDPNYPMVHAGPEEVEDITTNFCIHHPILPVIHENVDDPAYIYRGKVEGEVRKDDFSLIMRQRKLMDQKKQEEEMKERQQRKIRKEKELLALYGGIDVNAYFKEHSNKDKPINPHFSAARGSSK